MTSEARRLKAGRWRIYDSGPKTRAMRDPATGAIPTFKTLDEARAWLARIQPAAPELAEALRCSRCGGYFGPQAGSVDVDGKPYHRDHAPKSRQRTEELAEIG